MAVRIGAVRGAADNSYTAGVICAKVSRYAERIHHPDRLTPSVAADGTEGFYGAIPSGSVLEREALDRVARTLHSTLTSSHGMAAQRCGHSTMPARWGWCSATASTGCGT